MPGSSRESASQVLLVVNGSQRWERAIATSAGVFTVEFAGWFLLAVHDQGSGSKGSGPHRAAPPAPARLRVARVRARRRIRTEGRLTGEQSSAGEAEAITRRSLLAAPAM